MAWPDDLRRKYGHPAEIDAQEKAALAGLSPVERALLAGCPPPLRHCLVAGCGAGREVLALAAEGWRVAGMDLADEPLEACRDSLARRSLAAELIRLDRPLPWPWRDDSFGAVLLLAQLLEHLPEPEERLGLLREARRVLAPGGLVYLSAHDRRAEDRDELAALAPVERAPGTILANRISAARSPGRILMHLYSRQEILADLEMAGFTEPLWLVQEEPGGEHPVWRRFLYIAARKSADK